MRNVFLALVLANLAFAAWHSWFAGEPAPPALRRAAGPPGITLVSELPSGGPRETVAPAAPPPEAATQAATASPIEPSAPPGLRCLSIGPFGELAQAAAATAALRAAGHGPAQRVAEGDIWVGYWVYLPQLPSRERAEEILALFRSNGIDEAYATPGDAGYLISLGVFSEVSRAGNRREEVRALGFEPVVVDRNRRGTVYWVDITLGPEETLDLEALQTPGRITRLEQRSCTPR
jgi:hypothetical protein